MRNRKQLIAHGVVLLLTAPFMIQAAGLEIYYDFEDALRGGSVQDQAGMDLFASRHSSRQSNAAPEGTADVPGRLSVRSRSALDTRGGLLWVRNGATVDLSENISINFWFRFRELKNQRSTFVASLQGWRLLYNRSQKQVEFQVLDNPIRTFAFPADLAVHTDWSMLTLVKKGTSLRLYVNSEEVGKVQCDSLLPAGGGFYIGCASTAGRYGYVGLVDDFAIWSSAVTERQVRKLYQGTSPMELFSDQCLERTVSSPLPDTFPAYFPPTEFSLSKGNAPEAVIVATDQGPFKETGRKLQQILLNAWGVRFPVVSWDDAEKSGKALILFGPANANEPVRRMAANFMLNDNGSGYELRAVPDALDWNRGVLYLGGKTEAKILEGAERFSARHKNPGEIPFFIECEDDDHLSDQETADALVAEMEEFYQAFGDGKSQTALDKFLCKPVALYKMTGRDEYAAAFAKMQKIFSANFDSCRGPKNRIPTFTFHLFPQYLYTMEHSPAFTAEDRVLAAEILRKITEATMDYWEMTEAKKLYQLSKQSYVQNHECFAARSVEAASRYLLTRYNYKPAEYWKAVADNVFAGVAPHPFSPEDAAGYQYLVYRIFVDYAVASGEYDSEFLKTESFKEYIDDYAKPMLNHLGYTAGYGDAPVTGMRGSWQLLKQAVDIFGDEESEYQLDLMRRSDPDGFFGTTIDQLDVRKNLPPPGESSHGLHVVELRPFKQKRYQLWGLYQRPALDKAIFRSGWESHADFMAVTGINGGPHGHFDANGISQYISGNRLWLIEGDYIKKFPYDHNSLVVCRDGKVAAQQRKTGLRNQSRASQITASTQTPDRKLALLSLLLEDYNGVDWTRNIAYMAKNGFWVVDELNVKDAANYTFQCYWRTLGKPRLQPQGAEFIQTPSSDPAIANHFFITEGSGAARTAHSEFDFCHGRKDGTLAGYRFAEKFTRYLIQRQDGNRKAGDTVRFVNFMQAVPGNAPHAPEVVQIADGVFLASSETGQSLAVLGPYSAPELQVNADICFISENGITARGAKSIQLGSVKWTSAEAKDVSLKVTSGEVSGLLARLQSAGKTVLASDPTNLPVPERLPGKCIEQSSAVTATAGADGLVAVGETSGLFTVYNAAGTNMFTRQFPAAVSAVCSVESTNGPQWAVAVRPENLDSGDASVYLVDGRGEVLWEQIIEAFHNRNGTVHVLFTARINGADNPPVIIAGSEGWHYYAFTLDGQETWRESVVHAATVGAAGDMDGDGKDDIAPGCEYYYHSLINSQGATVAKKTTSPYDYSVAVCDLNSDGLDEAVFGRGDGYLYVMTMPGNEYSAWSLNVGGKPVSIVELNQAGAVLAAATDTGVITFIDGDGKKTGTTRLPAPVTDMKLWKGKLLATALDGYAYVIDLQGQVQLKIKFRHDIRSVHPAKIATAGQTAAVFSGSEIYLIR